MKLKSVLFACCASLTLYLMTFVFVVHKPLTVGTMRGYFEQKLSYLQKSTHPRLVILAGSNGRFSHRCETIEAVVGIPCTNMSVSADLSLDYQLDIMRPHLNAGDTVYLPLEYEALSGSKEQVMAGAELPYVIAYDHDYIARMPADRLMHALFYPDLKFLISGLGEMALESLGIRRRFSLDTVTQQGDESGHTVDKGKSYREYLSDLEWQLPAADEFEPTSYKTEVLSSFLEWAAEKEVTIVGGLPTTFNDEPINQELVLRLCSYYRNRGHRFIMLKNKSQYPRDYFFDTPYHLAEEYQIQHSRELAYRLKENLSGDAGPHTQESANDCASIRVR